MLCHSTINVDPLAICWPYICVRISKQSSCKCRTALAVLWSLWGWEAEMVRKLEWMGYVCYQMVLFFV